VGDNNIEKPQQVVVCAACEYGGVLILGPRHWDKTMRQQYDMMKNSERWKKYTCIPPCSMFSQGFIDQFGDFLTREEAMKIALAAGQKVDIKHGCGGHEDTLFSEGLY